jgi:protein O-GlcNAc transferase
MPLSVSAHPHDKVRQKNSSNSAKRTPERVNITGVFANIRSALAAYEVHPEQLEGLAQLRQALRAAAAAIATFPRQSPKETYVSDARTLITAVSASGAGDHPLEAEDIAIMRDYAGQGWPGILATMLLGPAWQSPGAPALDTVPDWLWGDYSEWMFTVPQRFTALGQTEAYAKFVLPRMENLLRWVERNSGSAAVRLAHAAYIKRATALPVYFSTGNLKRYSEVHARLTTLAYCAKNRADDLVPTPREGRRLRIGFVNRHFGSQTETYTTLPSFEHLDPQQFEVVLFAMYAAGTTLEKYAESRGQEYYLLPEKLSEQLSVLRAAALDVVVFGTNVTGPINEVTRLALHRVAPLQAVNNSSCITSGMPEVDLYLSGSLTESVEAPAQFSERLGLMPGPAHAFNYEIDRADSTTTWTRESLGLPEDAVVFVSAANFYKLIPEMQHAWARLLKAVPDSRLLVHPFNPNWSKSYSIERFCAEFDRVLAQYGIDPARLCVSSVRFPSRSDVKELLRVGDIYLDTFPFGGVNSMIDPLELGLPVIAWEGDSFRSRMGAALLRTLGLDELIATDEASYQTLAARLAADPVLRKNLRERIRAKMEAQPIFLDSLAASDACGDILTTAYDELCRVGRKSFRETRTPLAPTSSVSIDAALTAGEAALAAGDLATATQHARAMLRSAPAHPEARHLLGRILLAEQNPSRAALYLLAALPHHTNNASLWFDVARALRENNQTTQAIEAIEGCLRLDEGRVDAWLLLADLALAAGLPDMARDTAQVLTRLAKDDPRVVAFLATLPTAEAISA